MKEPHPEVNKLLDVVKEAAADLLRAQTHCQAVEVQTYRLEDLPFFQQMAQILVSGEDAELTFKVHFMMRDAAAFARARLKTANFAPDVAIDFMKEYCNVVAGKIKACLEDQNIFLGLSLPFVLQGFHELFFVAQRVEASLTTAWQLSTPDAKTTCSVVVLIKNPQILATLGKIHYQIDQNTAVGSALEIF